MKITKTNYEEYAIDYIEGTLSREDRRAFEQFLETHPEIAAQIDFLRKEFPVLEPDLSIRFEDKASLKRKASLRPLLARIGAVAAVLLIGIVLFNHRPAVEDLGNPELLAIETPLAGYPEEPKTTGDSSEESPILEKSEEKSLLLADVQSSPVRSSVKSPAETVTKTVEVEPNRTLLPKETVEENPELTLILSSMNMEPESTQPEESEHPETEAVISRVSAFPDDVGLLEELTESEDFLEMDAVLVASLEEREEQVLFASEEYVVEQTNEVIHVLETRDYFQDENDKAGFLNVFSRKGMKRLASGVLASVSELSPVKIYENQEERVIEFASIPVSRKLKDEDDKQ